MEQNDILFSSLQELTLSKISFKHVTKELVHAFNIVNLPDSNPRSVRLRSHLPTHRSAIRHFFLPSASKATRVSMRVRVADRTRRIS
ncbi:hypothetical protein BJX70DRAFT_373961 [Aspergillus crustosus]